MSDHPAAPTPHPGAGSRVELWLARHAEVHEDWQGRAYGDLDVPLSEAGRERTEVLAAALASRAPRRVLSSPLERALALGRRVAALAGVPLDVDARLREIHRGSWQGRTVADLHEHEADAVRDFYADPWRWCGHGGESDAALAARAWPAIEERLGEGGAGPLVVTTHYNVLRVLTSGALGVPPARSFALRVDPGRCVLLDDAPGGWRLLRSNAAV